MPAFRPVGVAEECNASVDAAVGASVVCRGVVVTEELCCRGVVVTEKLCCGEIVLTVLGARVVVDEVIDV